MPNRSQTSTADWIEAGYEAVGRGGLDSINIEAIAEELGVSKAGFYHRFRNRQALIALVIEHWAARAAERFERHAAIADPDARIRAVVKSFIAKVGTFVDLYINSIIPRNAGFSVFYEISDDEVQLR